MANAGGRAGFHTVTPYLTHPDITGLVAFVEQAFGAVETFRSRGSAGGRAHRGAYRRLDADDRRQG